TMPSRRLSSVGSNILGPPLRLCCHFASREPQAAGAVKPFSTSRLPRPVRNAIQPALSAACRNVGSTVTLLLAKRRNCWVGGGIARPRSLPLRHLKKLGRTATTPGGDC